MAIGVAAVTAVFSVISPLMLRPLPFAHQERLVWVAGSSSGGMSAVTSRSTNLRDYRIYNRSFEALTGFFAFFEYDSYNLVGDGPPERLVGAGVAQDFLPVLGIPLLLGRNFTDEESVWNGRRAAILTHGFWTRRFGADPKIIGRSITLNSNPTRDRRCAPSVVRLRVDVRAGLPRRLREAVSNQRRDRPPGQHAVDHRATQAGRHRGERTG
jgi:putative ABC transport system permease protein